MKKILLLASLFLIMVLASGCYNGYTGEHVDLYTEAINSVPWVNGYSWGADFKCDPEIEIIDEDQYGRVMFTYYEKYYSGADISFSALIICQGSNEKEVFYYEDENYIVKKQVIYSQNLERFTEEEIEKLKANNDWNKKISYDKCVRKEITRSKPEIPNEEEIKDKIVSEFSLVNGEYSLYVDYLTNNQDNSKYIIYGYTITNEQENICFIGLVEKGDCIELRTMSLSNAYEYKTEFVEFKKLNNWYLTK